MSGTTLEARIQSEVRKRLKRATGRDRAALLKKGAQEAKETIAKLATPGLQFRDSVIMFRGVRLVPNLDYNPEPLTMNTLQTELALPAYTGLSDADAAAALNAPIVTGTQPVPLGTLKLPLYQDATPCAMLRIATASVTPDTAVAGAQLAAQQANAYLNDPHMATIDLSNATVAAGLALLVEAGVLSTALVAQVQALGQIIITRAKQLGYRKPITAAQVTAARNP